MQKRGENGLPEPRRFPSERTHPNVLMVPVPVRTHRLEERRSGQDEVSPAPGLQAVCSTAMRRTQVPAGSTGRGSAALSDATCPHTCRALGGNQQPEHDGL